MGGSREHRQKIYEFYNGNDELVELLVVKDDQIVGRVDVRMAVFDHYTGTRYTAVGKFMDKLMKARLKMEGVEI